MNEIQETETNGKSDQKRVVMFLVFGGASYYPCGGGWDLLATTSEYSEAEAKAKGFIGKYAVFEIAGWSDDREDDLGVEIEWSHIVEANTGRIISEFGTQPYGGGQPVLEIRET